MEYAEQQCLATMCLNDLPLHHLIFPLFLYKTQIDFLVERSKKWNSRNKLRKITCLLIQQGRNSMVNNKYLLYMNCVLCLVADNIMIEY